MSTFAALPDFVAYQLLTYVDLNTIRENMEFFETDVLGGPAANSDYAPFLKLNNGATDGGKIYFDDDDNAYLDCDPSGTSNSIHTLSGISLKLTSPAIFRAGKRSLLTCHSREAAAFDFDAAATKPLVCGSAGQDIGFGMPYAGSLIGIWFTSQQTGSGGGGSGVSNPKVYKNNSLWLTGTGVTNSGVGTPLSAVTTYNRGAQTFAQGDYLVPYVERGGSIVTTATMVLEVLFTP